MRTVSGLNAHHDMVGPLMNGSLSSRTPEAGPQAHNATQRKGRGEKPMPKGVQFGPRITDAGRPMGGALPCQSDGCLFMSW